MARRIAVRIARALRTTDHRTEQVHFHAGPAGQPYACHDSGCQSPPLEVSDA
jgi:hypothetical protein